ncbi:hypothetical protein TWF481_008885 [Arthrobotrys musiformis]|uniref:Terpene synthase n=1 Tax=Arthrobotrys musiformis TaxID=47236 RepID=A0AAV9W8J1_9PEZI
MTTSTICIMATGTAPLSSASALITNFDGIPVESATSSSSRPRNGVKNAPPQELFIHLPNLFPSFLSTDAATNAHYTEAKAMEREEWVSTILNLNEKAKKKLASTKFGLLTAYWVPGAPEDRFWTFVIFTYWIFIFDDRFDEGDLHNDIIAAARENFETLAIFEENQPLIPADKDPLKHMFQRVWMHIKAYLELQSRYKESVRRYMLGLLKQVYDTCNAPTEDISIEQYLDCRRSAGALHITAVVSEWASGITVPECVAAHPVMWEFQDIIADICGMHNDMLSIKKDLVYGTESNLVIKLWRQDRSMQEAVDEAGRMLYDCYEKWRSKVNVLSVLGLDHTATKQAHRLLECYCYISSGMNEWR